MIIKLEHQTPFDLLTNYRLYIDGQFVRNLSSHQYIELPIPQSPCNLQVKKGWQKPLMATVSAGDDLVMTPNKWSYLFKGLYAMGMMSLATINLLRHDYPWLEHFKYLILAVILGYMAIILFFYLKTPTISLRKRGANND